MTYLLTEEELKTVEVQKNKGVKFSKDRETADKQAIKGQIRKKKEETKHEGFKNMKKT